jgi:hypothetical protein
MIYIEILFVLLVGHCLADYPMQGDYMTQAKNRYTKLGKDVWQIVLLSHAAIHGGMVYFITGSIYLGIAELICHTVIDLAKCERKIGFNTDQLLHAVCKVIWAGVYVAGYY